MDTKTIVPGIKRIGGYTELHQTLMDNFTVVEGDQHDPTATVDGSAPNYFRFAYDWRRDNRASAMQLKALIDAALPKWRAHSGHGDAEVILIAHSMGGLVARWYLEGIDPTTKERLRGWHNVRQLITFGTPYRGSLDALGYLVEGFEKFFIDFSTALSTFTGAYQLMPRYAVVKDMRSGSPVWRRPAELLDIPALDHERAKSAHVDFYEEIDAGVIEHRHAPQDGPDEDGQQQVTKRYDDRMVTPIIGFGHQTDNSATLTDAGLIMSPEVPQGVPATWVGGDGTVPYVSAIPLDYDGLEDKNTWSKVAPLSHANKKHGEIQTDEDTLISEVVQALKASQQSGSSARVMPDELPGDLIASRIVDPQIALNMPDWVMQDQQIRVEVPTTVDCGGLTITVTELTPGEHFEEDVELECAADAHHIYVLPVGEYEIRVTGKNFLPGVGQLSSSDLVAVIDPKDAAAND